MADEEKDRRLRRRQREDEAESESLSNRAKEGEGTLSSAELASIEKFLELLKRAESLIEQVNNLYNFFFNGFEQRPPFEKRKQLEQVIATLTVMSKPTQSYKFRFSTLNSTYLAYRDKWEKNLKDLETGVLIRVPKRKSS